MSVVEPIRFSVSYKLREYLRIVRDHLPDGVTEMRERGAIKRDVPRYALPFLLAFAAVMFCIKKWKMPVCGFVIDERGVERTTAGKTKLFQWSDIAKVFRYRDGYLVTLRQKGAMPLPYRCFSPEEINRMELLIAEKIATIAS